MTYVIAASFVTVTTSARSCEIRAQLRSDSTRERPTDRLYGISYYVVTNERTFGFRPCFRPFYFVPKHLKQSSALPRDRSLVSRSSRRKPRPLAVWRLFYAVCPRYDPADRREPIAITIDNVSESVSISRRECIGPIGSDGRSRVRLELFRYPGWGEIGRRTGVGNGDYVGW